MTGNRPEWPTSKPDAATLIRYCAGSGQFFLGATWGYVGEVTTENPLALARYMTAIYGMQHAADTIMALKALAHVDQKAADDLAAQLWGMADAGDCYGEALWEWATEAGLDPEAIHEAGVAAAKAAQT